MNVWEEFAEMNKNRMVSVYTRPYQSMIRHVLNVGLCVRWNYREIIKDMRDKQLDKIWLFYQLSALSSTYELSLINKLQ